MSQQPLSQCFGYWVRASLFIFHLHSPSNTNHLLHKSPFWICDLNNTFQKKSVNNLKTNIPTLFNNSPMNQIINLKSNKILKKHLLRICFPRFFFGVLMKNHGPISGGGWFSPPPFAPNQRPSTPSP